MVYTPGENEEKPRETTTLDHAPGQKGVNGLLEDGTIGRQYTDNGIREKVRSYAFKVKDGERPVALIVKQRPDAEAYCRSHYTSFLPSRGPGEVRLPLERLPMQNDLVVVDQPTHPLRLGQLQIVTTAVATTSQIGDHLPEIPGEGHHFVVVSLGIKNVGKDPNCSSLQERLIVDRGYEYSYPYSRWFPTPKIEDLLPGRRRRSRACANPARTIQRWKPAPSRGPSSREPKFACDRPFRIGRRAFQFPVPVLFHQQAIQLGNAVQHAPPGGGADSRRVGEIEHRVATGMELHPLVFGRQKAIALVESRASQD